MRTAVFSIVSPNYRHFARVLMDSVRRHHPDWDRFVLFVGDQAAPGLDGEAFTAVPLGALPLPHPRQFCFRYTILELNTAVKPWMFEYLFARGYDRVVYFDPDIFIYSPLAELDAAAPQTFLTLTPHLTGSIGGDEHPSERTILQAGTYNLGFLAVTRQAALERFLGWWKEKLEFQCLFDPARGLFVDQKWMDLAPALFPDVSILRHEGFNVAYWNLRQRSVAGANGTATVNGQPLRFFHFSGLDAARPGMVSRHDGRLRLEEIGDARQLIEDYRVALSAAGSESFREARYGFEVFADGTRVADAARVAYLHSAELQAAAGPDPFAHPELFRGLRDPLVKRVQPRTFRMLLRARPLVHWLPGPVRSALRNFMLGRRDEAPSGER
ncbi:MAG TPA: group 1 glycosyl transferase [Thermoanaerobaculia bacterium]|nr:group 1 glycosyl transferase [Thermoanaerobaculia bacterium]